MAIPKGKAYNFEFVVLSKSDPFSKKSGLLATNFSVAIANDNQTTWTDLTNPSITEIGTSGRYILSLSSTVMNYDKISIKIEYPSDPDAFIPDYTIYTTPAVGGIVEAHVATYATGLSPGEQILTTPANKLATTATGRVTADSVVNAVTVGGYLDGQGPAEQILIAPSNKLATMTNGAVVASSVTTPVTVGDYTTGKSPSEQILVTPANKLATNASGEVVASNVVSDVNLNMAQILPTAPTTGTIGSALKKSDNNLTTDTGTINTNVLAVKTQTDKLKFDSTNNVKARTMVNDDKTDYGLSATAITSIFSFVVDSTRTLKDVLRLMLSVLVGKRTVANTVETYYAIDSTTKQRVAGAVDPTTGARDITLIDTTD